MNDRMKIAFISTRGIPNNYGGFEEFAEKLGVRLAERGHDVIVYNPSFHPFKELVFNGVRIKRKFSPESAIGPAANFIYDYLSLRDAIRSEACDAALVCGYTTSAIAFPLLGFGKTKILTNMDGLEWMRSKWSPRVQRLAKRFEKMAVERSHVLVSDNKGIAEYIQSEYGKDSYTIAYGAEKFNNPNEDVIATLGVEPFKYLLLVGRMEPENNFEMILEGIRNSKTELPTIVVSSPDTAYAKELVSKFADVPSIRFVGWVGDRELLSNLRHFATIHFHGHSVGGTNPSLLEAMASSAFVAANDNRFNRSVLDNDALYFADASEVSRIVDDVEELTKKRESFAENNLKKIDDLYNWDTVADMYENMLHEVTGK